MKIEAGFFLICVPKCFKPASNNGRKISKILSGRSPIKVSFSKDLQEIKVLANKDKSPVSDKIKFFNMGNETIWSSKKDSVTNGHPDKLSVVRVVKVEKLVGSISK